MQENELSQIIEGFKLWRKSKDLKAVCLILPSKEKTCEILKKFRKTFKEPETDDAYKMIEWEVRHNVKKWYSSTLNEIANPKVIADLEGISEKEGKTERTKQIPETTSLKMFIGKYCKEYSVISSKVKTLQKYARKKKIRLPKLAVKWQRGQAKLYHVRDLISNWPKYRQVMPSLPELK